MIPINRVFIANRGEIAVRIIQTLKRLGMESVVAFSDEDKHALFVQEADVAIAFNANKLSDTYLNAERILAIAKKSHCDAIHPGYGFLSENADFAQKCRQNQLIFIGPSVASIELMGDKVASRQFAQEHGIPLLPGVTGSAEDILAQQDAFDYPIIIKAAAGGGGKGMRVVYEAKDLPQALETTRREALSYFGDDHVFVERYIENPRHIEVQIVGDQFGHHVHLYERECTVQRRHQKIIEEALSATLNEEQRQNITETALKLAKAANFYSLGTVEFIVDDHMNFYFMEMNTRIQVEHPVTELILDLDLVELQLIIARKEPLHLTQSDIKPQGHAIECRIYAEDPNHKFRPAPGIVTFYHQPDQNDAIRCDTSMMQPGVISDRYDPMIAKMITWGEDRLQAIELMSYALEDFIIEGVVTNIDFLQAILADPAFINNAISTNYAQQEIHRLLQERKREQADIPQEIILLAGLLYDQNHKEHLDSVWHQVGFYRQVPEIPLSLDGAQFRIPFNRLQDNIIESTIYQNSYTAKPLALQGNDFWFMINDSEHFVRLYSLSENEIVIAYASFQFHWLRQDVINESEQFDEAINEQSDGQIDAPIPGSIIQIMKKVGDAVASNETLLLLEAMKMENEIKATQAGIISELFVSVGQQVQAGQQLVQILPQRIKDDNDE